MKRYDAIVVGAGHNGLTTACYLAKAGLDVVVVERNDYVGGAAVSRELYEGWTYSNCSYVCSLLRPEIVRDLDLPRHGLQVIPYEGGLTFMKNGDYFICTEKAANNFAYQEMTETFGKYERAASFKGSELIGMPVKAPLAPYETIYILPMKNISMQMGTGVVTSVPSDSPDDWAALRDIQTNQELREKMGIKDEWCMPFQPVPIIRNRVARGFIFGHVHWNF